jgi:hypothetical protein
MVAAGKLASIRKSGVGDPDLFAPPNERVPLAGIRFMEDSAASQADVINGRATIKIDHEGRTLLVIKPDHGPPITVQIEGTPVIATGFPRERAPGEAIAPHTAVAKVKEALGALTSPEAAEVLRQIGARSGTTEAEAGAIGRLLHDPAVIAALTAGRPANDPVRRARDALHGSAAWADARTAAQMIAVGVRHGDSINFPNFITHRLCGAIAGVA